MPPAPDPGDRGAGQDVDVLRPRGLMVSFGNASGSPPQLDLHTLNTMGSLYVTRPSLMAYVATTEDLRQSAADLFARVESGAIKITIGQRYKLEDIRQVHRDAEARKTTGSAIIIP